MKNAMIIAELLGIPNPVIRESCYAGWEICWFDNPGKEDEKYRIITYVEGYDDFCYTKNVTGLPGDWVKVDYWFLYL